MNNDVDKHETAMVRGDECISVVLGRSQEAVVIIGWTGVSQFFDRKNIENFNNKLISHVLV